MLHQYTAASVCSLCGFKYTGRSLQYDIGDAENAKLKSARLEIAAQTSSKMQD